MASIIKTLFLNTFKYSFAVLWLITLKGFSQSPDGMVRGRILDGTTFRPLNDVHILMDSLNSVRSGPEGGYVIKTRAGLKNIQFSLSGFQTKTISDVVVSKLAPTTMDIILYPLSRAEYVRNSKHNCVDSLPATDTVTYSFFKNETLKAVYNSNGRLKYLAGDVISIKNISAGTDKNGLQLLKRLNGLVIEGNPVNSLNQSMLVSGMGARYNQFMFNGAVLSSFDAINQSYPVELVPAEAIEEVNLQSVSSGNLPANFAGGTVNMKTRDFTEKSFFFMQLNGGFSQGTAGQDFYGDSRNTYEPIAFSGAQRNLPAGFPTTRSAISLDQLNPQEKVYQSQQLKNNLAPHNYGQSAPNERILLGFGKNFTLKNGSMISLVSYLNQMKSQQINEATVQVFPDVAANPFPFQNTQEPLIRSQSSDTNYNYTSQIGLVLNGSIRYGKSKISFRNFLGSQLANVYITRHGMDKPDEDSLAHYGINYLTTQRGFYIGQLSGEHALGVSGKLHLSWLASYTYYNQQNPDERNFLLRTDSTNHSHYEIASPLSAGVITNTGRLWRNLTDNNVNATFNISAPFNLFGQPQVLAGGIYIQENYRVFYSDLLLTQGAGFHSVDQLIDPQRYYPGGLAVSNYYVNTVVNVIKMQQVNRGNYSASANLGAAYIQYESHLSNKLVMNLGIRIESNSQLAYNTQYRYFTGYKYPQLFPVDENTKITTFNALPSVRLEYSPVNKLKVWGSYFGSVNRPYLQELIEYAYYYQNTFMLTTGNALLASTTIDNYNAGVNWLLNAFSNISIGGFYKKINQPIENIISGYTYGSLISTPHNTPPATVSGLEASLRIMLSFIRSAWLSHISVFASGNITNSNAEGGPVRSYATPEVSAHTLSGTPDYTFRAGMVIQQPAFPEISIIYRNTGEYITALGSGALIELPNGNSIRTIPDYRMKSSQQLDIQVSQKFFKSRIQVIAGANSLLAGSYTEYQDLNGNKKFDSPLTLHQTGNSGGYYSGGTDNTVISIKQWPTFYFAVSYSFK